MGRLVFMLETLGVGSDWGFFSLNYSRCNCVKLFCWGFVHLGISRDIVLGHPVPIKKYNNHACNLCKHYFWNTQGQSEHQSNVLVLLHLAHHLLLSQWAYKPVLLQLTGACQASKWSILCFSLSEHSREGGRGSVITVEHIKA